MIHDPELLDQLSSFAAVRFEGEVFRATRMNLDPLAPSTSDGRWAAKGTISVLYTSLAREGALAELSFHWSQLTPLPTKPAALHRIRLTTRKTLRLVQANLSALGVNLAAFREISYGRMQAIGAAAAFLACDGLIVPSARWNCDNLILFMENHDVASGLLEVVATDIVDWLDWARSHQLIGESGVKEN